MNWLTKFRAKRRLRKESPILYKRLKTLIGPVTLEETNGVSATGQATLECWDGIQAAIEIECFDSEDLRAQKSEGLTKAHIDTLEAIIDRTDSLKQKVLEALWIASDGYRPFLEDEKGITLLMPSDLEPYFNASLVKIPREVEIGHPEFCLVGGFEIDPEHGYGVWLKDWEVSSIASSCDPNFNNWKHG